MVEENYYSTIKVESILSTLIDSLFIDGKELQSRFDINARQLIYSLLQADFHIYQTERQQYLEYMSAIDYYDVHILTLELPYLIKRSFGKNYIEALEEQVEKVVDTPCEVVVKTLHESPDENWRQATQEVSIQVVGKREGY